MCSIQKQISKSLDDIEYLFDQTEYYNIIAKGANMQLKKLLTYHFKRNINCAFLSMSFVLHRLEQRINEKLSGYDDLALYLREGIVEFEKKNMKREINRLIYLAKIYWVTLLRSLESSQIIWKRKLRILNRFCSNKRIIGQEAEDMERSATKYIKLKKKLAKKYKIDPSNLAF